MNLIDLETFVRVAELGTMSAAAKALGVPKSTVSRRISKLEDQLGVDLLVRGGRRFRLTDQGALIHERCGPALREISDVETALGDIQAEPTGTLRMTAPADVSLTPGFGRLISCYRRKYPKVTVELDLTNRVVDLIEEGFDVALRPATTEHSSSGLMSRSVGSSSAGWYASPAYLLERGTPQTDADLADHDRILHLMMKDRPWRERFEVIDPDTAAIFVNDFNTIRNLAVAGCGVAVMPCFVAMPAVAAGELTPVLSDFVRRDGILRLIWPASRHLAPRVRTFIDLAVETLGDHLM